MKKKTERILGAISLICDAAVFVLVALSVSAFFVSGGDGNMSVTGAGCFIFFTVDSNILAALACLLCLPFHIRSLIKGKRVLPMWAKVLKFTGAVAVAVTFFTVILFLGPTMGYASMFAGTSLYLHLICPLAVMFSLIFLDSDQKIPLVFLPFGLLPTLIYGAVYLVQVVVLGPAKGGWEDFYGFNAGGFWYISLPVMLAATYLISLGICFAHNGFAKVWLKSF